MPKCFLLTAYPFPAGSSSYTWKACGESSSLQPRTDGYGRSGVYWVVDGTDMFNGSLVMSGSITVIADNYQSDYGSCNGCTPVAIKYDCINGDCIDSSKYKTLGIYQSLADCQAVCANGGACGSGKQCVDPTTFCPSGKVCIDQNEYSEIQALISKINSEVC